MKVETVFKGAIPYYSMSLATYPIQSLGKYMLASNVGEIIQWVALETSFL